MPQEKKRPLSGQPPLVGASRRHHRQQRTSSQCRQHQTFEPSMKPPPWERQCSYPEPAGLPTHVTNTRAQAGRAQCGPRRATPLWSALTMHKQPKGSHTRMRDSTGWHSRRSSRASSNFVDKASGRGELLLRGAAFSDSCEEFPNDDTRRLVTEKYFSGLRPD